MEQLLSESISQTTVTAMTTTGVLSLLFGIVLKGAMRKILNIFKSLQIILHIMLIRVVLVSHADMFISSLQDIVFANLYDKTAISFPEKPDDSTSVNSVSLSLIAIPILILLLYLF